MNGKTSGMAVAGVLALALLASSPASAGVADCGMLTNFASVSYNNTAGDNYFASYAVTAAISIATPSLVISKVSSPTMQGAGGTVQFCISFQNLSWCASAIDVLITDKVPDSMNYVVTGTDVEWTNGPNNGLDVREFSSNGIAWTAGIPAVPGQYYLRWAYDQLAPRESGVICFRASVL